MSDIERKTSHFAGTFAERADVNHECEEAQIAEEDEIMEAIKRKTGTFAPSSPAVK